MRRGTRGLGYGQAELRSVTCIARKARWGIVAFTLLAGLSCIDTVVGLLVGPAEAHKSPSRLVRGFDRGSKGSAFQAPVLPLPAGQAFAPSLPTKGLPPPPPPILQSPSPPPVLP